MRSIDGFGVPLALQTCSGGSGEGAAGSGCYKDAKDSRVLTGTSIVKDDRMTHEVR